MSPWIAPARFRAGETRRRGALFTDPLPPNGASCRARIGLGRLADQEYDLCAPRRRKYDGAGRRGRLSPWTANILRAAIRLFLDLPGSARPGRVPPLLVHGRPARHTPPRPCQRPCPPRLGGGDGGFPFCRHRGRRGRLLFAPRPLSPLSPPPQRGPCPAPRGAPSSRHQHHGVEPRSAAPSPSGAAPPYPARTRPRLPCIAPPRPACPPAVRRPGSGRARRLHEIWPVI